MFCRVEFRLCFGRYFFKIVSKSASSIALSQNEKHLADLGKFWTGNFESRNFTRRVEVLSGATVAEFAEVQRSHAKAANRIDHNCVDEKKSADEILNAMAAVQRGITEK